METFSYLPHKCGRRNYNMVAMKEKYRFNVIKKGRQDNSHLPTHQLEFPIHIGTNSNLTN